LEGHQASLSEDPTATLLGSQDGQRLGQVAEAFAAGGEGETARHLDGRHEGTCKSGVRPVHKTYEAKYPKAVECLTKDREVLLTFYDFPAEHWIHVRTTNPIESTFATVRLRTKRTKGCGSRIACLTMVYKLMQSASKKWRLLNGTQVLAEVLRGTIFIDGICVPQVAA